MINRKVASLILLAALDYKAGDRSQASRNLQLAAEDPDFDETLEGMGDVTDKESDPFLDPEEAESDEEKDNGQDGGADADLNLNGLDDLLNNEQASLARRAKQRTTATEEDKIGGNEGPTGADADNNSDEEIRQEASAQTARYRQVRANLQALASVR